MISKKLQSHIIKTSTSQKEQYATTYTTPQNPRRLFTLVE